MRLSAILLSILLAAGAVRAKNIDLVTLPDRATVQLTIYNSEDLTLVKETRRITLRRGANRLQFSWANTLIDPSSVEFRPIEHAGEIELLDTVFPGQKPQHLIWNIESSFEGEVKVEVSYFTSGLTWSMDYVAETDPAEETMDFRGYVRVFNSSGEDYEDAQVRLVVGTINLVERISDLARRQGIPMPQPGTAAEKKMVLRATRAAFAEAESAVRDVRKEAKKVVKEGFSEYFMFTVDGSEHVRNGWSKRMRALETQGTAFEILYRMRAHQYGPRPVRFFLWGNDKEHTLGDSPLPDGLVRVFRRNGRDGLSYLGQQQLRYVPIGAPIEVNLGADDLVVYERRAAGTERFNFRFHRDRVNGWDERQQWVDTIRNDRGKPIRFELRRIFDGDIEFSSEDSATLSDYRTVETTFAVAAHKRRPHPYTLLAHQAANRKQARVVVR